MVMPVCYFTDEVSPDIGQSLERGREAGAECVELRSRLFGKRVDQLDGGELAHLGRLIAAQGLYTAIIASSFGKCDLDSADEWMEHQEILRGSIRAAHALAPIWCAASRSGSQRRQDLPRPIGCLPGPDRERWAGRCD